MNQKIQDGIKLRQFRVQAGLSQAQAGGLIHLSQSEYDKIENEEQGINIQNLTLLATEFHTEIKIY